MTVVDELGVTGEALNLPVWGIKNEANTRVIWEIDIPHWKQMLFKAISS